MNSVFIDEEFPLTSNEKFRHFAINFRHANYKPIIIYWKVARKRGMNEMRNVKRGINVAEIKIRFSPQICWFFPIFFFFWFVSLRFRIIPNTEYVCGLLLIHFCTWVMCSFSTFHFCCVFQLYWALFFWLIKHFNLRSKNRKPKSYLMGVGEVFSCDRKKEKKARKKKVLQKSIDHLVVHYCELWGQTRNKMR